MLKYKKIISSIVLCVFMLCCCMPAFADTNTATNENTLPSTSEQAVTTSGVLYYDSETEEITFESEEELYSQKIEIAFPATTVNGDVAPLADIEYEQFFLSVKLKSVKNGQFTWAYNLDCPTSLIDKPNVTVSAQLKGNFTNGSSYSNVGGACVHKYTSNTDYLKDFTWTTTAKTGYYRFYITITNWDMGGASQYYTSSPALLNRSGKEWTYVFSDTGKALPKPRADWVKGQVYQRDPKCRENYFKTYTEKTGKVLNEALYEVHHIQPLSYGGDNSYSNLIHLPTALHSQVTGWFNGY